MRRRNIKLQEDLQKLLDTLKTTFSKQATDSEKQMKKVLDVFEASISSTVDKMTGQLDDQKKALRAFTDLVIDIDMSRKADLLDTKNGIYPR